ncbi:MAG TPA: amidase [Solirubrobacterales bacterium]|jgi:aspartyl-tRNA(Asn)/glutamyl-tRNA(Gln) amidotransferase subunit A
MGRAAAKKPPAEAVEAALRELEATQARTNACVALAAEAALSRAASPGPKTGPLWGMPFVVKDAFDLEGVESTWCSRARRPRRATADARAVRRLVEAGAIPVAKANQHELAAGATNLVSAAGPTANPWDPRRMTGGSSGGSAAAVAAGAVPFALGTDAGGSVRIPAALCGVTGLKPTHGTVSLDGVMRTAPSLDVAGPIALSAGLCRQVLQVIRDEPAPPPAAPATLRIGMPRPFFELLQEGVGARIEAVAETLRSLGHTVVEVDGPDPEEGVAALHVIAPAEIAAERRDLDSPGEADPSIAALLELGAAITAVDYLAARAEGEALAARFRRAFETVDLLLTPTTPYVAPRADEDEVAVAGGSLDTVAAPARLTNAISVAGLPAISFPAGSGVEGMPVGAQLVGPWGSDETLCEVAVAYQAITDHHLSRPR